MVIERLWSMKVDIMYNQLCFCGAPVHHLQCSELVYVSGVRIYFVGQCAFEVRPTALGRYALRMEPRIGDLYALLHGLATGDGRGRYELYRTLEANRGALLALFDVGARNAREKGEIESGTRSWLVVVAYNLLQARSYLMASGCCSTTSSSARRWPCLSSWTARNSTARVCSTQSSSSTQMRTPTRV